MGRNKDPTEQALRKLQKRLQTSSFDPAKELPGLTKAIPEDLSTEDHQVVFLSSEESAAFDETETRVLGDLRFEHLDRNADETLWGFVCLVELDRKSDHVPAFMEENGREPEERTCFIPVEALTVEEKKELLGVSLLPLTDEAIPKGDPWFSLDPPAGSAAAIPTRGTNLKKMAQRARSEAEQALRVLRISLREDRWIPTEQLRFRLLHTYSFGPGLSGWQLDPEKPWDLELDERLLELAEGQTTWKLGGDQLASGVERRAQLALEWWEAANFETDTLRAMLFLFFALESLLGDKAEKLKGPALAFRRAMLSIATRGHFAHPNQNLLLYDKVRSAAVHGEQVPEEVTSDQVRRLLWDVRLALIEYLQFAGSEGLKKRSQVLKAIEKHSETQRLVKWIRENGGSDWRKFLDENFTKKPGE